MVKVRRKKDTTRDARPLEGATPGKRGTSSLNMGISILKWFMLLAPSAVGTLASLAVLNPVPIALGLLIGLILFFNTRIVLEWESAVVLRFGRLHRIEGPGIFFTIPLIEFVAAYVDQRITATAFYAEKTLTLDCVPVNVDAVLFWMVWDPKSACIELENYRDAVYWAAQTTLRDAIGNVSIIELSTRRKALDEEVKEALAKKTESWGITVVSVEVRDIVIPEDLQNALSKEAQAERERNARITLAEVEEDISEMFVRATKNYKREEGAIDLRAMNMLYDGIKEQGGLVLLPSTLADAFKSVGNGN